MARTVIGLDRSTNREGRLAGWERPDMTRKETSTSRWTTAP